MMVAEDPYFNPVYIIGDTPLSCFLSAKLSLAGENIYRLGAGDNNSSEIYILNDSTDNNKHSVRIPAGKLMHNKARMVLLCLSPEQQKSGLNYFSAAKAEQCPIISFNRMNKNTLSKILRCPVIPAYFDGWLNMPNPDSIDYKGAIKGLTLSMSEDHPLFEDIRQILAKTYLNIHYKEDNEQNFWDYFLPETLSALFSLHSQSSFKDISKKNNLRQLLNILTSEILTLVPENIKTDKEQLFREIYAIPNHWQHPLIKQLKNKQSGEFSFIIQTLSSQKNFNINTCPTISKIINKNLKQILSSVE